MLVAIILVGAAILSASFVFADWVVRERREWL